MQYNLSMPGAQLHKHGLVSAKDPSLEKALFHVRGSLTQASLDWSTFRERFGFSLHLVARHGMGEATNTGPDQIYISLLVTRSGILSLD